MSASFNTPSEWLQHSINYEALKMKLKQASDSCDEFLEVLERPSTSLSIPRTVSQPATSFLQHMPQPKADRADPEHQQAQECVASDQQQYSQQQFHPKQEPAQQQGLQRQFSGSGMRVPEALQLYSGPAEQFMLLLQQELNKVRTFITSQSSSLQADLQALAAAAPELAQQDRHQLQQQAIELGRQLLMLEAFMQHNEAGFAKIVRKHDKWMPEAPIWHLYIHHLQRSPWIDDTQRQYMWAALSSSYYHLHAASIRSSRSGVQLPRQGHLQRGRPPVWSPADTSADQGSWSSTSSSSSSRGLGAQHQQVVGDVPATRATGAAAAAAAASVGHPAAAVSARKAVGGLTAALGSAVVGAATVVAGAATAVAGAATAVAGASAAALAAAAAAGAPVTVAAPAASSPSTRDQAAVKTAKLVKKFWVRESDVPAVMYFILQHLPLLPSMAHPTQSMDDGSAGSQAVLGSPKQPRRQQQQQQHQQHQQQPRDSSCASSGLQRSEQQQQQGSSRARHRHTARQLQQPPQLLGRPALEGFFTTLHTVYLDNVALQLYHGRLYLRPQAQTLKARWIGHSATAVSSPRSVDNSAPDKVVLERKIYREGWKGEANKKDSLLIAGDKLPYYLVGAYTLGDALADLCEVPACKAQLLRASSHMSTRQQQPSRQQSAEMQSPFAQASVAAAPGVQISNGVGHVAGQVTGIDGEEEGEAAAVLASSVRLPQGLAIGSFSRSSLDQATGNGSHPSLLQLLERERQQQQQLPQHSSAASSGTVKPFAAAAGDAMEAGFADAYLDPPVPSADQLSLFTEVQGFVARKRLRPVLHCVLHRMVFSMPFDDRIRITLDTDVRMTAPGLHTPLSPDDWQDHSRLAFTTSRSESGALSPEFSTDQQFAGGAAVVAGVAAGQTNALQQLSLLGRRSSSGGSTNPVSADLQKSLNVWESMFDCQGLTQSDDASQHSPLDPGSPANSISSCQTCHSPVIHSLPYALLKVSVNLPAAQSAPDWLQQLMESEATIPVEDWSKFVHGCAVLLPEAVRAVPYWMDDELIAQSVTAMQVQLEAEEARRDQQRLQSLRPYSRHSNTGSVKSAGRGSSAGGPEETAGTAAGQPQPLLQRLGNSIRAALGGTTSTGWASTSQHPHVTGDAGGQQEQSQQMLSQPGVHSVAGTVLADGADSISGRPASRLRVSTVGPALRVSWADGGTPCSSIGTGRSQPQADAVNAAAGPHRSLVARMWRLVHKRKPPPLFRPQGNSIRRPGRGHPVMLLESREFFYSESILLDWLRLAITLASVAILLMGYSSMAFVNPLKRTTLHVAELICLLMLPCSCIIVGYAIRTYLWRRRRLLIRKYDRVDDQMGPLVMTVVFVACMSSIMLVNIADLLLLLRARQDEPEGGDDGMGGDPARLNGGAIMPLV